jgi:membrane associated rhomboid family serine protease
MIIPRIGAVFLLIGYGFAVAQVGRLMYVAASEGYSSWAGLALFLAPTAIVGLASALLVLWRRPLGYRLVMPFLVLLGVTAVFTFFELPPVGGFLNDYEQAALARGVEVPAYLAENGVTPEEYVADEAGDIRAQGALGAIAAGVVYFATTVRGSRARASQAKAGAQT